MRISVLTPFTKPVIGGIASYTAELALAYVTLGNRCLGLALSGWPNADFQVLGPGKMKFVMISLWKLLHFRPDLVHSHSHWYTLLPGILCKVVRPRTRLVFTFHSYAGEKSRDLGSRGLDLLLRFCDGVSFVSHEMKQRLALPSSIRQDVVYAAPETLTRALWLRSVARETSVVAVAPFVWPQKVRGVHLLLEAFRAISSSYPRWDLIIIGDGPLRVDAEKKAAELGIVSRVRFLGSRGDALEYIAKASVFAQITFQEGLPLSLLNAMALGTSVIATPVGGIPEVIQHRHTGYLVPPTARAVADGLQELIDDEPLRNSLAANARRCISERFTWDTVARRNIRLGMG